MPAGHAGVLGIGGPDGLSGRGQVGLAFPDVPAIVGTPVIDGRLLVARLGGGWPDQPIFEIRIGTTAPLARRRTLAYEQLGMA